MKSKPDNEQLFETEAPNKKSKGLLIAFFLCFIFSVATSSGVTFFLMQLPEEDKITDKDNEQDALLLSFKESIEEQNTKLIIMKDQNNVLQLYLRHSSATALKNILINQEQNIQAYLKVMKLAMKDLSDIVPRTTDWNDEYQYQLDLAQKGSMKREDLLKLLKTGEPNDTRSAGQ
ncbi:hypothetical protein MUS1_10410 [Marinomonas ushuaiensis DSM 15871]|uniref:Uncharacterized protein n=1 Tax=Marinomonas ushuaiensis DSM 15871 TaxID=1122207 RepID=X7E7R7_9GAMM|nr:hypothetical protein [Marinomonas ushuaiensis]ETX11213.1 hypothetical protein MUS1_10410 [Marinomonas ushuaiensis DSM 15871]